MDHYLNISLLELYDIVCQIHIEKESDVWFGRFSQWLAQLAELPRQPFGLVFSLRSQQTSWGVLKKSEPFTYGIDEKAKNTGKNGLNCFKQRNPLTFTIFVNILVQHQIF